MTSLTRRDLGILAAAAAATLNPAHAQLRSGPGAKYKTILVKDLVLLSHKAALFTNA